MKVNKVQFFSDSSHELWLIWCQLKFFAHVSGVVHSLTWRWQDGVNVLGSHQLLVNWTAALRLRGITDISLKLDNCWLPWAKHSEEPTQFGFHSSFSLLNVKLQVVSQSALAVISSLSLKTSVILERIDSEPLNVGFIVDMWWREVVITERRQFV